MGGRLRCGIALITAVAAVWGATPALAQFPAGNGNIAFTGRTATTTGIYAIEPDGSGQRLLVEQARDPSWSPGGDRLAFAHPIRPFGIHLVKANGTGRVTLTSHSGFVTDSDPDWSPDATRIAFGRSFVFAEGDFVDVIYSIGADGSDERVHADGSAPSWSPDGQRLVYAVDTSTFEEDEDGDVVEILDWDIAIRNVDSPPATPGAFVTRGPERDLSPEWSPDGSQIAFTRDGAVHIMNADGSGLRFLTSGGFPSWSPDGTRIAFARGAFRQSEVYTIAVDGSDERRVTSLDDGISATEPDWERLPAPRREDFKNAAKFCQAEREFWGEQGFRERYGGKANAHGKCVSSSH